MEDLFPNPFRKSVKVIFLQQEKSKVKVVIFHETKMSTQAKESMDTLRFSS